MLYSNKGHKKVCAITDSKKVGAKTMFLVKYKQDNKTIKEWIAEDDDTNLRPFIKSFERYQYKKLKKEIDNDNFDNIHEDTFPLSKRQQEPLPKTVEPINRSTPRKRRSKQKESIRVYELSDSDSDIQIIEKHEVSDVLAGLKGKKSLKDMLVKLHKKYMYDKDKVTIKGHYFLVNKRLYLKVVQEAQPSIDLGYFPSEEVKSNIPKQLCTYYEKFITEPPIPK